MYFFMIIFNYYWLGLDKMLPFVKIETKAFKQKLILKKTEYFLKKSTF